MIMALVLFTLNVQKAITKPITACQEYQVKTMDSAIIMQLQPVHHNTAELTKLPCPDNVCLHSPLEVSQILTVPLYEAVTILEPSAENTADTTQLSCPDNVCLHSPVELSQTLAVRSPEAVTILEPSAENTAERTSPSCSDNVCLHSPVELSQILVVLSSSAAVTFIILLCLCFL